MARHANPRLTIGPKTNELILQLGRASGVRDMTTGNVMLLVSRRRPGTQQVSTWTSYVVDADSKAHFEIAPEFINSADTFPRGFYDAKVMIGECHVGDIEIIKAPGRYIASAQSVSEKCHGDTIWVEPNCTVEEDPCTCTCQGQASSNCDCSMQVKNNCPTCYNETFVVKANLIAGYSEWVEKEPPTLAEVQSVHDQQSACVNDSSAVAPVVVGEQQHNDPDGYIDVQPMQQPQSQTKT